MNDLSRRTGDQNNSNLGSKLERRKKKGGVGGLKHKTCMYVFHLIVGRGRVGMWEPHRKAVLITQSTNSHTIICFSVAYKTAQVLINLKDVSKSNELFLFYLKTSLIRTFFLIFIPNTLLPRSLKQKKERQFFYSKHILLISCNFHEFKRKVGA